MQRRCPPLSSSTSSTASRAAADQTDRASGAGATRLLRLADQVPTALPQEAARLLHTALSAAKRKAISETFAARLPERMLPKAVPTRHRPTVTLDQPEITDAASYAAAQAGVRRAIASAKLLMYALNSRFARPQLIVSSSGASRSMQNVSQEAVLNLVGSRPPRHEQDSIATFLDTGTAKLDAPAAKVRRGIKLLKERRLALIIEVVLGQRHITPEMVADPPAEAAA